MNLANDLFSRYQHTCLELFADSIRMCDHFGSRKWGVAFASSDHIRLLMGSLIVASIEQSCFWLEIDPPEESESKVLNTFINLRLTPQYCYRRPVGKSAYYWPMNNHAEVWPNIQRLQARYLAIVARLDDVTHCCYDGTWDYRISFTDRAGATYRLGVTDLAFRVHVDHLRETQGVDCDQIGDLLERQFQKSTVFLRIGLARPTWAKHPHCCFLQINGVYSFPDYLEGRCFADFRSNN